MKRVISLLLVFALALTGTATVQGRTLAPGVEYLTFAKKTNLGGEPLNVYALKVDINARDVELLPVMAGNRIGATRRVSQLAEQYGAVGAINGVFYHSSAGRAMPVGNIMIDGKPLAIFDYYRTSLAFSRPPGDPDRLQGLLGYFAPRLTVDFPGGSFEVKDVNSLSAAEGIHLYTPEWGEPLPGGGGLNALFAPAAGEGEYRLLSTTTVSATVPPEGFVLRFIGAEDQDRARALPQGRPVRLNLAYDRDFWGEIEHLFTAGPLLVEGGEPVFQSIQEGFTGTILQPNTRSALGITSDGSVLLVVAEAASGSGRVGLTFEELALLMVDLGAQEALGLDGGGSSTLYVEDRVVNRSRLSERAVPQAFMVLVGPKLYLNGQRIFPDVPPRIREGRVLVPLRIIMENLQARVAWDEEERKVTVERKGRRVELFIDRQEALVDGRPVALDVPPVIDRGRTLVPIRFVSENLQGVVHWDEETRSVNIHIEE